VYLDGGCWKLIGEHTEIESGKLLDREPGGLMLLAFGAFLAHFAYGRVRAE
jgi:hypothetical protein